MGIAPDEVKRTAEGAMDLLKIKFRATVGAVAAGISLLAGLAAPAAAQTSLKVSLNAPFDGSNAAFFLAEQRGYYKAENVAVALDASGGSGEVVTRIGSGVYDLGFGDINVLMDFDAKNPANAGKAVYMLYYRSPLSAGTLARAGINKPADLMGRTVGAALTDGAYRLFPAYAALAGIKADTIKWQFGDLRLRETLLQKGGVDAILGFDSTMYFNLVREGVAPKDIKFLYFSDVGLNIYGNALIASKHILATNPAAVRGFVKATAEGWRDAIADPPAAIAALKARDPLTDAKLELEKLHWLIKNQLVTDESKADGLGGVRPERLAASLTTVGKAFDLPKTPAPSDIFTSEFLPDAAIRKLP